MNFLRNTLYNMRNGFARFMYGRNGMDQLNLAIMIVMLAAEILAGFFAQSAYAVYRAVTGIATVMWFVVILRMFSKNLAKRRAENQKWVNFYSRIKGRSAGARARHADKEHKYFTCKTCGAICRVPAGKGKIVITCPKCGNQIQGKT